MSDCADCGGFDIEWMRQCHKHKGVRFCRGCSCPYCADEDVYDDDNLDEEYTSESEPAVTGESK